MNLPQRLDTKNVHLPESLLGLLERLAEHVHDIWAAGRRADGWTLGPARDDETRKHPSLIPYAELSESEKDYDRATAAETLRAILALGYVVQPRTASPAGTLSSSNTAENAELLQRIVDPRTELRTLLTMWQGRRENTPPWEDDLQLLRPLADRLVRLGALGSAQEVITVGLETAKNDVRLQQLQGLAWARSGAIERANRILSDLATEGYSDEETLGILARTFKDLGLLAADPNERHRLLQRAREVYGEAYCLHRGYWTGINAATLAALLHDPDDSRLLSSQVRSQCELELARIKTDGGDRYWPLATLGEVALIANDLAEAEARYTEAVAAAGARYGDLHGTRQQARLLLHHHGHKTDLADRWLPVPRVVVFVGHPIDSLNQPAPRFPAELELHVREAIQRALIETGGRIGYSSAAWGADILFQEALAELGGEGHVVLPYEADLFSCDNATAMSGVHPATSPAASSSRAGDIGWNDRFRGVLNRATQVIIASAGKIEPAEIGIDYAGVVMDGLARVRTAELGTELIGIAVVDSRSSESANDPSAIVARWKALGLPVVPIDLATMLQQHCPQHASRTAVTVLPPTAVHSLSTSVRVMALLFADAVGYSKLNDIEVPRFIQHFLGGIADLIQQRPGWIVARNTWGDGLYLVFEEVREAGLFALDLCDWVAATNWSSKGLPATLSLRIALHAGPVFAVKDPVTGQPTFTGSHVSRCARIEPITPAGQVYASQGFAALSAGKRLTDFSCRFVKQAEWAKSYGTFPTFVVQRR